MLNNLFSRHSLIAGFIVVLCMAAGCGTKDDDFIASGKAFLEKNDRAAALVQFKNAVQKDPANAEGRMLLGMTLYRLGDPANAEVELSKAKELGMRPDTIEPELLNALLANGRWPQAIAEVEKALPTTTTPAAKAALAALKGDAHLLRNEIDLARKSYEDAVAFDAQSQVGKIGLARVASFTDKRPEALRLAEEVLAADKTAFDAWIIKGSLLVEGGKTEEAIAALEQAKSLRPWDMRPYSPLISAFLAKGDTAGAEATFEEMKKSAAGSIPKHYAEALIAFAKGDKALARTHVQEVLKGRSEDPLVLMLAARVEHDLGNFMLAERYLLKVTKASPKDTQPRLLLVSSYLRMGGQTQKAKAALAPVLEIDRDNIDGARFSGEIAMLEGNLQAAIGHFEKVLASRPDDVGTILRLGRAHLAANHGDQGVKYVQSAMVKNPNSVEADETLITYYVQKKDLPKAKAIAELAVKRLPDNPGSHQLLGLVSVAAGDRPGARALFEKSLKISPTFLPAARGLAQLDLDENKVEAARGRFRSVLEADPRQPLATYLLADILEKTKAPPSEIMKALEAAIASNGNLPALRAKLIEYLLRVGDRKGALERAQAAQATFPNDPAILALLAKTQALNKENDQAISSYSKLAGVAAASPEPLLAKANIYASERNWNKAIESVQQAINSFPDHVPAYVAMVGMQLRAGRPGQAKTAAMAIRKRWPTGAIGYAQEAKVAVALGQVPQAEQALRDGLTATRHVNMLKLLHVFLAGQGRIDDADKELTKWLAEHPKDVDAMIFGFTSRVSRRQYKEAERWVRKASEAMPESVRLMNDHAWVLGMAGDQAGLPVAKRAFQKAPNNVAVRDTLGALQVQFGEVDAGVENLTFVVSKLPDFAQSRINLARGLAKQGKAADARVHLDQAARFVKTAQEKKDIELIRQSLPGG